MMKMRALKIIENYIPGRTVKVGELFETRAPTDGDTFIAVGLAEAYEPPKKIYKTRQLRAEEE